VIIEPSKTRNIICANDRLEIQFVYTVTHALTKSSAQMFPLEYVDF
jgi:hypothetical protein